MNAELIRRLIAEGHFGYNGEIFLLQWDESLHLEFFGDWEFRISPDHSSLYLQFGKQSFSKCLIFGEQLSVAEEIERGKEAIRAYEASLSNAQCPMPNAQLDLLAS